VAHAAGSGRITRIADRQWHKAAPEYTRLRRPDRIVVDTFPFGLRGEWMTRPEAPMVYLARRLRLDQYAYRGDWSAFETIIAAEPLSREHDLAIWGSGARLTRLPGPIRLRPGTVKTAVPVQLERLLDAGGLSVLVHSGPVEELRLLESLARGARPDAPLAAITPWPGALEGIPCFDYFPFGNLAARAARVFSGGGYNIVADMTPHRARHTPIAFERRWDDQAARLASLPWRQQDGTAAAAEAVMSGRAAAAVTLR
jgi:hypothetical protein